MNHLGSILAVIFGASEIALSIRKRASGTNSRLADRGSLRLIWIVIACSIYAAFSAGYAMPQAGFGGLLAPAKFLGFLFFVAGLALRWYAIIYLGRFFTVNVAIAVDHQLIDGGPYRYIRHPSYTGALLTILGLGLCIGNWVSIGVLVVPVCLALLWRMHVEEAALLQGFGHQYRSYMERTNRLVPSIY